MTVDELLKTIPVRKSSRRLFRGIIYFDGRMTVSDGPLSISIKSKYNKTLDGKLYSIEGNKIDIDIKEIAELNYKLKQYISNRRSYTIGFDELKNALKLLKKTNYEYIKCCGETFSIHMLNKLLNYSEILEIDSFNISSYKDVHCLIGISQSAQNTILIAQMRSDVEYENCINFENILKK